MFRNTIVRSLHTTPVARKTLADNAREVADKVNKSLGKGLASAIDKGEEASKVAKEKMDTVKGTAEQTKERVSETAEQTRQRARKESEERLGR